MPYNELNKYATRFSLGVTTCTLYAGGTIIRATRHPPCLKKVVIEDDVRHIDSNAFSGYEYLESVEIKSPNCFIATGAFECCPALREVKFTPNASIVCAPGCFADCPALVSEENIYVYDLFLAKRSGVICANTLVRDCSYMVRPEDQYYVDKDGPYSPNPIDLTDVPVHPFLLSHLDTLAEHLHELNYPNQPFSYLPDDVKERYRRMALDTYRLSVKLGWPGV